MKCRSCGAVIADNALICYKCGTATAEPRIAPPKARPRASRWPWALLVAAAIAALAVAREVGCGSLL